MIRIRDILIGLVIIAGAYSLLLAIDDNNQTEVTFEVTRIIDGDTLVGDVTMAADEGEPLYWAIETRTRPIEVKLVNQRLRVLGVDAWERGDGERGKVAKAAVTLLILAADRIELKSPYGWDNFGRLVAGVTVHLDEHRVDLKEWLIENEHGVTYRR